MYQQACTYKHLLDRHISTNICSKAHLYTSIYTQNACVNQHLHTKHLCKQAIYNELGGYDVSSCMSQLCLPNDCGYQKCWLHRIMTITKYSGTSWCGSVGGVMVASDTTGPQFESSSHK